MCFSSTGCSLSGVTIGDGDVIGACNLVAHDVPPYAVATGNPCRVIRMRFGPEDVETVLDLRWRNWPRDAVVMVL